MASVVPSYDRDRVRTADIKKLIVWYGILRQYAPEVFETTPEAETTEAPATNAVVSEVATVADEAPVAEEKKE